MYPGLNCDRILSPVQFSLSCNGLNLLEGVLALSMKSRRRDRSWEHLHDTDALCFKVISNQSGFMRVDGAAAAKLRIDLPVSSAVNQI